MEGVSEELQELRDNFAKIDAQSLQKAKRCLGLPKTMVFEDYS